jgi:hypothetical protein
MSLVSVITRPGDRPGELPETHVVPLGVPQGMEFDQVFSALSPVAAAPHFNDSRVVLYSRVQPPATDLLIDLAAGAEPDGGMPGKNSESRALSSALALLAFVSQGHTLTEGAFRSHVARLVAFLEKLTGLSGQQRETVDHVLELARKGKPPAGDWLTLARTPGDNWKDMEKLLLHPH